MIVSIYKAMLRYRYRTVARELRSYGYYKEAEESEKLAKELV